MSTIQVTGKTIQQNPFLVYEPGLCDCRASDGTGCGPNTPVATCDANDWQFATRACCGRTCPQQPRCSKIDPQVCPNIGWAKATQTRFTQAPNVECTYNVSQITTLDDLNTWARVFGQDDQYNNVLVPAFCAQPSTTGCPADINGIQPTQCSRFRSNNAEGQLCRNWQQLNRQSADSIQQQYCSQFPGSADCLCINRDRDFVYQSFRQYAGDSSDACWFRPCADTSHYLVPQDLQAPQCDPAVCASISTGYTETQKGFVSFNRAQSQLVCELTQPPQPRSATPWIALIWILIILAIIAIIYLAFIRR